MAKRKKPKAPRAISDRLNKFDRVSGAFIGSVTGSVNRANETLHRLNDRLNKMADSFERMYESHSNDKSNF